MRLVIEHIGIGPHGGELVSVAHYGEQNNDPMRDPEIVFEVAAGQWHPVRIQQDYIASYRESVFVGEDGKVDVRPALVSICPTQARPIRFLCRHRAGLSAGAVPPGVSLALLTTPRLDSARGAGL